MMLHVYNSYTTFKIYIIITKVVYEYELSSRTPQLCPYGLVGYGIIHTIQCIEIGRNNTNESINQIQPDRAGQTEVWMSAHIF